MRVVIAEDQALLREGIVALLREKGIDVVAQAEDGAGLLRILAGHKPDLAIVDVRLPPTFTDEGIRAALEARAKYPGLGVLILSQYVEPVYTAELLDSGEGGIGYLLKERVGDVKAFVAAVESVANGGTALDREVVSELVRRRDPDGERRRAGALTPREKEVLGLMAKGKTNTASRAPWWSLRARSRSTSPTSSASWTCPPPTKITGGFSPFWPSSARGRGTLARTPAAPHGRGPPRGEH